MHVQEPPATAIIFISPSKLIDQQEITKYVFDVRVRSQSPSNGCGLSLWCEMLKPCQALCRRGETRGRVTKSGFESLSRQKVKRAICSTLNMYITEIGWLH